MPGLIAFPTVVKKAVEVFGGLFANAPERRHFGEYLTGLLVSERKTYRRSTPSLWRPRISPAWEP